MKRKKKFKPVHKFRKCFPIRWKKCAECKEEFRLEVMWKTKLITYTRYLCTRYLCMVKHKTTKYVCMGCAPTNREMDRITDRLDDE